MRIRATRPARCARISRSASARSSAGSRSRADSSGRTLVCDIGLGEATADDAMPRLVDARWVRAHVPPIRADAHKGTRKKLVIVGGQVGMAGAPMLAARAAMRSGIGMVRVVVARENLPIVQTRGARGACACVAGECGRGRERDHRMG